MKYHVVLLCIFWFVGCALVLNVDASIYDIFLHFYNKLTSRKSYSYARQSIIDIENEMMTGGRIRLNRNEMKADEIIRRIKAQEVNEGLSHIGNWPPAQHFFKGKEKMEQSNIFKILKIMPKGAVLHGHNEAMLSSDAVMNKIIPAFPDLLMCRGTNNILYLLFRRQDSYGCTTYLNVNDEIKRNPNTTHEIMKAINLYTPTPEIDYPHIQVVWDRFQNIFSTTSDFLKHIGVFRTYLWWTLKEFYDDGVMYIEFRSSIGTPYNSTGYVYSNLEAMAIIIDVVNEFKKTHPDFVGVKFIYSTSRRGPPARIQEKLDTYIRLRAAYPEWIVGFDLVGQEDLGMQLEDLVDLLSAYPGPYYFHAGETNFYGAAADTNLVDSLLLGSKRIGHGTTMIKHPFLLDILMKQDIAIEVSPISNQVLHLVWDLRNHPAAYFISEDIPMVISCDDPGYWNSKAMTPDYYYAFMSFASAGSGIRLLKQLVLNTIKYACLTSSERVQAANLFEKQWDFFVDNVIAGKY